MITTPGPTKQHTRRGASAAAMSALALLTTPALVQAQPITIPLAPPPANCGQFGFNGIEVLHSSSVPEDLTFDTTGSMVSERAILANAGGQDTGNITGNIKGRNVSLSVIFDRIGSRTWTGTVNAGGVASGQTSDGKKMEH